MNRSEIIDTAKSHITKDRAATHGNAEDGFSAIAGHWTWWLQSKLKAGHMITAHDVAQMMVGFKQARAMANAGHADNFIDEVGYAALAGEIALRDK